MAPKKKSIKSPKQKRVSKGDVEKLICKRKLDALDHEESQSKDDRLNPTEKKILLDAYSEKGFSVFQDIKLLHKYLPHRRESDLKGLIDRLKTNPSESGSSDTFKNLDGWIKTCHHLLGNYAKNRRINIDEVIADAILIKSEIDSKDGHRACDNPNEPNYPALIKSFSQLLSGKFPDAISPADARISMKLYDDLISLVDGFDLKASLAHLEDGSWIETAVERRRQRLALALQGLEEMDMTLKKYPTILDIEKNRSIEALCLELPKIRRIIDALNPLYLDESLIGCLLDRSEYYPSS